MAVAESAVQLEPVPIPPAPTAAKQPGTPRAGPARPSVRCAQARGGAHAGWPGVPEALPWGAGGLKRDGAGSGASGASRRLLPPPAATAPAGRSCCLWLAARGGTGWGAAAAEMPAGPPGR